MNDTQDAHSQPGADAGFDPQRLRSLTEMKRAKDGRLIAGVCEGAGRYLNIDPVIIRVILGTLTFFGFAGLILYGAAWLLLPEEGSSESIAKRRFNLDKNEETVRILGLITAAIIAIASATSMIGGAWDTPFPYLGVAVLGVFWLFVIRPRQAAFAEQRRELAGDSATSTTEMSTEAPAAPADAAHEPPPIYHPGAKRPRNPRHDRGRLTLLTLFATMIAIGAVWVYSIAVEHVDGVVYFGVALGVIAAGILVGSFFGNAWPLIPLGILAAAALFVAASLPATTVGQSTPTPRTAADVHSSYKLGIGQTVLDLTQVADLPSLDGRTINVETGIGETRVYVPAGLDVDVHSKIRAGEIRVFDQEHSGSKITLNYVDPSDNGPNVTLDLSQTFGDIEVVQR